MKYYCAPLLGFMIYLMFSSVDLFSQNDSIVFTNSNYIVGEIKNLDKGVIQIETDFSDSDFKIEWDKIKYINSDQIYIILLSDGRRFNGTFESFGGDPGKIVIQDKDEADILVDMTELVLLKPIDQSFLSRLDLMLSAGYTLTKANNSNQLSGRIDFGYLSNTIGVNGYGSMVRGFSESDGVKINTRRTEGGLALRFFLIRDWFAVVSTDLLQSTEQMLDLRAVTRGGVGNYVINNQEMYLILSGGAAWNFENYSDPETADRNSAEAFAGIEYNIFNLGDLKIATGLHGYQGITEKGRFRTDFNFNINYEFAFDLFFGVGFSLNYDNQPVSGASTTDYVFQTNIGWEL